MAAETALVPLERIEGLILLIRGQKVIVDKDLAALYGVTTGNLNKAVSRNLARFPDDFTFRLTRQELENLKFQFGTSSWGGTRKLPRAFTEQGVAMLSQRPAQPACRPGQHSDHADLRQAAPHAGDPHGAVPQAGRPRAQVRQAIQGRLRCHPRADDATSPEAKAADRVRVEGEGLMRIADGWIKATLGELIEVKHGFAFKGQYFRDEPPGAAFRDGFEDSELGRTPRGWSVGNLGGVATTIAHQLADLSQRNPVVPGRQDRG